MKKFFIMLLLLAPVAYAYHHKPQYDTHREKIYVTAKGGDASFDEEAAELPEWDGLYFVDWKVFTATREKTLYTLVSFGLLDYVVVLDSEWAQKAFKLPKKRSS